MFGGLFMLFTLKIFLKTKNLGLNKNSKLEPVKNWGQFKSKLKVYTWGQLKKFVGDKKSEFLQTRKSYFWVSKRRSNFIKFEANLNIENLKQS